jgi:hypothetical protein
MRLDSSRDCLYIVQHMLYQLIYSSRVGRSVRFSDAEAIAEASAARNQAAGLSGLLIYTPSHFLQVLEGSEPIVRSTLERISRDPRHSHLKILSERSVETRAFGRWAMHASMPRAELRRDTIESLAPDEAIRLLEATVR